MKVIHKAYLKALDSTLFFLDDSPTMVAKLPIATPTINSLKDKAQTLYGIDSQLQSLSQLSAVSKTKQRKMLIELCLEIAAKGRAYAIHSENDVLGQILNTKISVLNGLGDTIFRDRAQMIKNTVEAEIANIDAAVFHLTAADLTAFQAQIDAYTQAIPGPNSRINQIKALNANFELLLTETKAVAKKLDALVDTVRFKEAVFYTQYYAVRKPKKAATHPRSLVFTVLDASSNLPLYRANVTFTAQKTNKTIALTTNKNGKIVIQNIAEDIYEGTVSETSYISADYTIPILDGKTFHKTILLAQDPTANRDARR